MSWDWEKLKQQQQGKLKVNLKPEKPKKKFKFSPWMVYTGYFFLWIILVIICWNTARWINYKFSYEEKIQKVIIEMVKPEALKEEYRR
jgi:hypothetical protein